MGYVNIDIDTDEIMGDIKTRDLIKELKTRYNKSDTDKAKVKEFIHGLGEKVRDSLQCENLIDEFKLKAFQEAMNKYSLDEIESRLK